MGGCLCTRRQRTEETILSLIVYVAPAGRNAGLTTQTLGLASALKAAGHRLGYLKPVALAGESLDAQQAAIDPALAPLMTQTEVETLLMDDELSTLQEALVARVDALADEVDVILVEGVQIDANGQFPTGLNGLLAQSIGARLVLAIDGGHDSASEIATRLKLSHRLLSRQCPSLVGVLVTSDLVVPATLTSVLGDALPVIGSALSAASPTDVAAAISLSAIDAALNFPRETPLTPSMFRQRLLHKAQAAPQRIVLPEGNELRTLHAALECAERGIAICVLVAERSAIEATLAQEGLTLPENGIEIVEPDSIRERYVKPLVELRRHKNMTPDKARTLLSDNVVLGTMMLAQGDVDGLVSGAVHTTASTVRPALQLIRTAEGSSTVSSVFFMLLPDQVMVFGDCAITPDPDATQLAEIAIQSAESAAAFGLSPRVALVSYSTGTSGSGPAVEKVRQAVALAHERSPALILDGPLQYDAATVPSVGRQKAPDSAVAGRANVVVFPDLNTGNATYKAVQRSAQVLAVGPMLQGLRKPVNDLSRGALVDDIIYTIALTAVQAQNG